MGNLYMESMTQSNIENKKLRIVHVVNEISPAGKEIGIIKLAKNLPAERFTSIIISLSGTYSFGILDLQEVEILSLGKKNGNDWSIPFRLSEIMRERQADIVHTHSWGTLAEGLLGAKLARIPVFIHGEHGSFPQGWKHRIAQRLLWRRADRVLAVSGELGDRMAAATGFPRERVRVILNGVNDAAFFPSPALREEFRGRFGFSADDFIVGAIGRFSEVKNQRMLLLAAAELIRRGERLHIALVSRGKKEQELRQLSSSLGIAPFTHFLGFQNHVNLALNGFDVFALTSLSEGCSNVIQEAMFCSRAVIATRVGGNPELIEDGVSGLLVESNDHRQLAEKILLLKGDNDLRTRLGENARRVALEKFPLRRMIREYETLYLEAYRQKRPG